MIAYYAAIASYALPHLAGRPLTLVRCPGGRTQKCFFQKHATENVPAAVQRIDVREAGGDKGKVELYMAVRDLAGLLAVAQLGALELHTWTCHADKLELPDHHVLSYAGVREFGPSAAVWHENSDGSLLRLDDKKTYWPDTGEGFYKAADGDRLQPGFKVAVGFANYSRMLAEPDDLGRAVDRGAPVLGWGFRVTPGKILAPAPVWRDRPPCTLC